MKLQEERVCGKGNNLGPQFFLFSFVYSKADGDLEQVVHCDPFTVCLELKSADALVALAQN